MNDWNHIKAGHLSRVDALSILNSSDLQILSLLEKAYEVRKQYWGNKVHIQYLANGKSGNCSEDCHYCSQSSISKARIDKYSLISPSQLWEQSELARNIEAKRFCTALSGKTVSNDDIDILCQSFEEIKKKGNLDICCSLGFISLEQAQKLKEAGLNRVNHNLNSSENYYPQICTSHTYSERIENIKRCKDAGLEICSGGILGQGESLDDIVDFFFELQALDPQSVPINFLIPQEGTPFAEIDTKLSPLKCLKILALARFMLPSKEIRLAAGREYHLKSLQPLALYCVNSIFVRGYLTSSGQMEDQALSMIKDLGFQFDIESAG